MAKVCEICGKRPGVGHSVSHAQNRTKRRWNPNLQVVRAEVNGRPVKMKVCTSCLKANKVQRRVRRQPFVKAETEA